MLLELLCAVLAVVLTRILWRRWKYDLHKIPSPPCWPLIGHTMDFVNGTASKQLGIYMREQLKSLGFPKVMRLRVAGGNFVVVTDIQYVYSVILARTNNFQTLPLFLKLLSHLLGGDNKVSGLIHPITPYVKAVRKVFLSAFQSSQLKKAMPKMDRVMQNMINVIESKRHEGPIDFQQLSVQFTLDTIGRVGLDMNLGGLDGSRQIQKKIIAAGHVARDDAFKPFHTLYCKLFPNSKIAQEQTRIINDLNAEWDFLAKEILKKDDPPEGETPLWYVFKTLKDPDTGSSLSHKSLRGELATVVVGGMDSTGHQLGWTLAMLASHPDIVDKLLEEFRERGLYGENARELTFEDLGELDYLSAVISESMRIAHISPNGPIREIPEDMTILGYRIPKGAAIMLPSNRSLMSEAVWGDPYVARPERWLTKEDMTYKYIHAFSKGPRHCVGERLAMFELRFAIVKLITKYDFKINESFYELLENTTDGFVMEAKGGIWLQATPREASNLQGQEKHV